MSKDDEVEMLLPMYFRKANETGQGGPRYIKPMFIITIELELFMGSCRLNLPNVQYAAAIRNIWDILHNDTIVVPATTSLVQSPAPTIPRVHDILPSDVVLV